MIRKILLTVFASVVAAAGGFLWYQYQHGDLVLQEIIGSISTPGPLRFDGILLPDVILTSDGVFTFTNSERTNDGKKLLVRNTTLDAAAKKKLDDMFARQYFEHESPTGETPSDVLDSVGYSFITTGENLALGNFESDAALVEAWMDSPGHRANILADKFQEIGIAVGRGTFEGRATWLAVQEFGTPTTACPGVNASIGDEIEAERLSIDAVDAELSEKLAELELLENDISKLSALASDAIKKGNGEIAEGNRIANEDGNTEAAQKHWDKGESLQSEGEDLRQQAQVKTDEYNKSLTIYNQQVTNVKARSATLAEKIENYNATIRAREACVESITG